MHDKQYSDEQNASVRATVREIVERDFGGTKATAAEALDVTAASLGDFLNGKKGVGNKLLSGLARYTGSSSAALLGEIPDDSPPFGRMGCAAAWRRSQKRIGEFGSVFYGLGLQWLPRQRGSGEKSKPRLTLRLTWVSALA